MGKQLNIRSDVAYELATTIALRRRLPLAQAVVEALQALEDRDRQVFRDGFDRALAHDQKLICESGATVEIDDLSDPETGLPV